MLKFCLMASHACPPGPGLMFLRDQNRAVKDCQCYPSTQDVNQNISQLNSAMSRLHPQEEPRIQEHRFRDVNQLPKIDLAIRRPVLLDLQESFCGSVQLSPGMTDWCTRHEKIVQFLLSRSSDLQRRRHDLSLLSDLAGSQELNYAMDLQYYVPVVYPSGRFDVPKSVIDFVGDPVSCSKIKNYLHSPVLLTGSATPAGNIDPILAEYYLSKNLTTTKWHKQPMLVPQFSRLDTSEEQADNFGDSLKAKCVASATLKRNEKTKLKSSPKKKNNRREVRERDLNRRSYLYACECLLSFIVDKPSGKAAVLSIKNSGPELPDFLTKISVGIAGTGLAVLLSVLCKVSSGSMKPFSASKFLSTGFGFGLVWLSLAVNRLTNIIVSINRNATKSRLKDGEIMRNVEIILKVIYVRGLTTITVALLAACI
ncbi:hypothetical protein K2173_004704 [Erythroxylum novogranatense]|uniref:Uncharacterized protein n=1 Tax=Erythroxylum novogranatense TaxID=1862640 RepID=A0AAV8U897_9ROSI|nr:hypothetical protein K2173_004704 [Erythroxylum novogranatense]